MPNDDVRKASYIGNSRDRDVWGTIGGSRGLGLLTLCVKPQWARTIWSKPWKSLEVIS
jgi:hypothetical protein